MREAVVAKLAITASDGKTCRVNQYDLDVIISVCYCVKIATLTAGVLTFTHLARRSLPLRRECSLARTLPAVKKERISPFFMAFPAGVLTFTHLKKRTMAVRF